ncbi:hypothetical protein [Rhodococcus sp. NPDC060176]|uniref:hypothetical protein n=1 Tax=Rhodococcus sp. NPDC060176 TaxID=3347062 RepID=UPI00365020A4
MADEKAPIDYTVLPADVSPTDESRGARYSAVDFDVPHHFFPTTARQDRISMSARTGIAGQFELPR